MKTTNSTADFDQRYQTHLKHLKLKGLQPKTIDAYARAIRRMGDYFDHQIDKLSPAQLTDYFSDLVGSHSWSAVKLDLYGFKFYTLHVLGKPWAMPNFIKPPKVQRLPDIVTVEEAQALFSATRTLRYLRGWTAYFGISQYYRPVPELDEWIRRRIRMCYWKQWRWARTKIKNLLALGVSLKSAIQHGVSSNSYWQMSRTPVINQAVSNAWLKEQGLLSVKDLWCKAQGYTAKRKRESFVERADLLNRPLRTRTVGGVGAGG